MADVPDRVWLSDRDLRARVLSLLSYHPETGSFYWRANHKGLAKERKRAGSLRRRYRRISIDGKRYTESHLVFLMEYGRMPTSYIDHIDGNPTNNHVSNLREVSNRQNCQNRKYHRTGKLPGVRYDPTATYRPWRARMRQGKSEINLGFYKTKEDAYQAYVEACGGEIEIKDSE